MYQISGPGWTVYRGDARDTLRAIPAGTVHTLVSSPPYWGMREYPTPPAIWGGDPEHIHQWGDIHPGSRRGGSGTPNGRNNRGEQYARAVSRGQYCACGAWLGTFGNEPSADQYVSNTVEIFRAIGHAMRPDGVVWWNVGDASDEGDRVMIPARIALALQADGWQIRQDVIWSKPGPNPEAIGGVRWERCRVKIRAARRPRQCGHHSGGRAVSVPFDKQDQTEWAECSGCDRCRASGGYVLRRGRWRPTTSTETLLMIARPGPYFADSMAVAEPAVYNRDLGATRNPRQVWTIPSESYRGAHFAVFPRRLVWSCIASTTSPAGVCRACGAQYAPVVDVNRIATRPGRDNKFSGIDSAVAGKRDAGRHISIKTTSGYRATCGCDAGPPIGATVCDPFLGSGTTLQVAIATGRRFVGGEVAGDYFPLIRGRAAEPWQPPSPSEPVP